MTANRLDLDAKAAWSAAHRDLEDRQPKLVAAIESAREIARDVAAGRTKQEIADALAAEFDRPTTGREPKGDLVTMFANATAKNTPESAELEKLKQEAWTDDYAARRINDAIEGAEALHAKVLARLTDAVGKAPRTIEYEFRANADEMMVAQLLAQYCADVLAEITAGADMREAIATVAKDAMNTVLGFPAHILANGTGSAYRLEYVAKATAAAKFARDIASYALGDARRLLAY